MWYITLIIIFVIILKWVEKNTFSWETVIKHLWKQVYIEADQMASHMERFNIVSYDKLSLSGFKGQIEFKGKLINTIIDYINNLKKQHGEHVEEETFGYGRFDFDVILNKAKSDPRAFEKLLK